MNKVSSAQEDAVSVEWTSVHAGQPAGTLATRVHGVAWDLDGTHSVAKGRRPVVYT